MVIYFARQQQIKHKPLPYSLSLSFIDLRTILFLDMTEQCHVCKNWFKRLVLHLRVSKCRNSVQLSQVTNVPKNICMPTQGYGDKETTQCESDVTSVIHNSNSTSSVASRLSSGHRRYMEDLHYDQNAVLDEYFSNNAPKTSTECRIYEHILEGMDELSSDNDNNDNNPNETETLINVGHTMDDDQFTIATEEQFFPLPSDVIHLTNELQQTTIANVLQAGTASVMALNVGSLYAPISSFDFNRVFTNEEYFMVKLCQICDKANVPHHIVDDVVNLLRECQRNNITVQPEHLRKRVHFL